MTRTHVIAALVGALLAPALSWLYITRCPDLRSLLP